MNKEDYETLVQAAMYYQFFAKRTFIACRNGLTKEQVLTMNTLDKYGSIRMSELSDLLAISKEQASRVVSSLEGKGFVKRTHVENNRRGVNAALTAEGKLFLEQQQRDIDAKIDECLAHLTDEELTRLTEVSRIGACLLSKTMTCRNTH